MIQLRPITEHPTGGENYSAQSGEIYFGVDSVDLNRSPR
jgi:hypothetical protein